MTNEESGPTPQTEPSEYKVGYGKPPLEHRFQKHKSGNASGRPKKHKTLVDSLGEALSRKVPVAVRGKRVLRSLRELSAHQLAAKMAEGNLAAIKFGASIDPYFAPPPEEEIIEFTLSFDEERQDRPDW